MTTKYNYALLFFFAIIFLESCSENSSKNQCESDLEKAKVEILALKEQINSFDKQEIVFDNQDSIPKNYLISDNELKAVFKPGLIKLLRAQIVYKGSENIAWLQVEVKNELTRPIRSLMFRLHSNDCKNAEDDYIEGNININPSSSKSFEIQISILIIEDKIRNCFKHPPDVEIAEAILETGERYPNTTK
jgi:hypothetical protein